jgi:hypothetical protein
MAGILIGALAGDGVAFAQAGAPAQPADKPAAVDAPLSPEDVARRKAAAESRPLFASSDPLAFTLLADFGDVQRDRDPESTRTYPATLVVAGGDGADVSIPTRIRTRGHSRRKPTSCTFAPLRVEFEASPIGTVFEGQGALKLGTHCRDLGDYEQYVLREYATYKILNVLTPRSFRARLAKARYVNANNKKVVATRTALFLEDDDDVARRLEGRAVEQRGVSFRRADADTVALMMIFEYMIGNTDMSMLSLHNIRLVRATDGVVYPVPYDFDYSGLVNTRYSVPDPRLGINSVRSRLYRGPCRTAEELAPVFDRFRAARSDVMAVYDSIPGIKEGYVRQARAYLNQFYETIDQPSKVKRAFIDGCDGRTGM